MPAALLAGVVVGYLLLRAYLRGRADQTTRQGTVLVRKGDVMQLFKDRVRVIGRDVQHDGTIVLIVQKVDVKDQDWNPWSPELQR